MSKIVNLNKLRKQQRRDEKQQQAEQNRALHGRTKAEKARDQADNEGVNKKLDDHRLKNYRVDKPEKD